jgi:hypothetical protein
MDGMKKVLSGEGKMDVERRKRDDRRGAEEGRSVGLPVLGGPPSLIVDYHAIDKGWRRCEREQV